MFGAVIAVISKLVPFASVGQPQLGHLGARAGLSWQ
jgi:hypothetical protein